MEISTLASAGDCDELLLPCCSSNLHSQTDKQLYHIIKEVEYLAVLDGFFLTTTIPLGSKQKFVLSKLDFDTYPVNRLSFHFLIGLFGLKLSQQRR